MYIFFARSYYVFYFRNDDDDDDPSKPLVYKDKKEAIEAFKDLLKEKVFSKHC